MMMEKTLESPLNCKEIQPIHPKGNQFSIFIGRTDSKAETLSVMPNVAPPSSSCRHGTGMKENSNTLAPDVKS